ncbi:hypothetical protein F2Q69_00018135 [Brassica cretica]|uniref:Uncharacterized protein n=1 Tax=Brassica cretica TaxID=69181 RepID=A0A8S9R136_BRACR|nr:hypothetical protein F2Q69_00018135 [Brassica cretica]
MGNLSAIYRRSSPGDNDLNGGSVSGVEARSCGEDGVVKSSGSFSFFSGRQRLNKLCRRRLLIPGGGGFLSSSFAGFVPGVYQFEDGNDTGMEWRPPNKE